MMMMMMLLYVVVVVCCRCRCFCFLMITIFPSLMFVEANFGFKLFFLSPLLFVLEGMASLSFNTYFFTCSTRLLKYHSIVTQDSGIIFILLLLLTIIIQIKKPYLLILAANLQRFPLIRLF